MLDPYGPDRKDSSLEMTAVLPSSYHPRLSAAALESVGADPDHPESRKLVAASGEDRGDGDPESDDPKDRPTVALCPVCMFCACCNGKGFLTADEASAYEQAQRDLKGIDEPDEKT